MCVCVCVGRLHLPLYEYVEASVGYQFLHYILILDLPTEPGTFCFDWTELLAVTCLCPLRMPENVKVLTPQCWHA